MRNHMPERVVECFSIQEPVEFSHLSPVTAPCNLCRFESCGLRTLPKMLQEYVQQLPPQSIAFAALCILYYVVTQAWGYSEKSSLTSSKTRTFRQWIQAYMFLFQGSSMIEERYMKANGQPFTMHTPGNLNFMITSSQHIQELDKAPRHKLSLHAVAKEFLQPKQTMHGFEWKDQRGIEGTGFVRAIKSLLTAHIPYLMPRLSTVINKQILEETKIAPITIQGYSRVPLFAAVKRIITRTNCAVFFPSELSDNPEFVKAALDFPEDVYLAAELIRILPGGIGPFAARMATKGHQSTTIMHKFIHDVVRKRLEKAKISGNMGQESGVRDTVDSSSTCQSNATPSNEEQPNDGIQWLINTTPPSESWSTDRLVGEIMAIWYGSLHTLAIATTYALVDLFSHPEIIPPLRAELSSPSAVAEFESTGEGLPMLDSFLKESARLSAFESTAIRRQALEDYTFFDGIKVPKGSWICVPHRAMMRDERHFPNATQFDGLRFYRPNASKSEQDAARLSNRTEKWMVWGAGRITCPGRVYAVAVLKLVLREVLCKYDCELEPIKGSRSAQWRSALIPRAGITLRLKARDAA
ncbi:cytochrome P450 [Dendryphion nanum]|uniref:Cytochrome P450 n=1 Tax=Dendryphion nanum TaxID=256645 RepID=A0A9P9E859_9PLEO|nr:cytochrome P450 [Dendryphion nanum]